MKIKSLLIGMLACTALVGCSNEEEVLNGAQAVAKGEKGYLPVNIKMPQTARSRANVFEAGKGDEVAVNDAVFLFLDGNYQGCANPFYVKDFSAGWEEAGGEGQDLEKTVLTIEGAKEGEVPAYVVAILNPTDYSAANYTATTSLADLKARFANHSGNGVDDTKFVMSNAAYHASNNKEMIATPILLDNIAKSKEDLANVDPVTIQVERVVGKVQVTNLNNAIENLNAVGLTETIRDQEDMKLKFVLTGWEVLQNNQSSLIKNVNATNWTIANWNDVNLKRSYWANDYTVEGRTSYYVTAMRDTEYKYVEETVNQTPLAASDINNANPYLLVAGKFVDADTEEAVNLVEWRGHKYTAEGYLNFMAGSADLSQYWVKSGDTYTSFSSDLLELVDANAEDATDWRAIAQLKNAETEFYTVTYKADGVSLDKATKVETKEVTDVIAKFGAVQYWNGGNTYYFVPIKHQTADETTNYYGVVRNHWYKVNISKIQGYGTPVSNPEELVDEPEIPVDEETWLQADIVILDWKVVENDDVVLGQ